MPILHIIKDGVLLQEFEIQAERMTIGRDPENDIRLGDLTVSRQHAQLIRQANDRYCIVDLQSRNGIRLNGNKITEPVALTDGDQIKIGAYQLIFLDAVEIKRLRHTHIHTISEKALGEAFGALTRCTGTPSDIESSDDQVASPQGADHSTKPLPPVRETEARNDEQRLEIGILVNEANNALFAIEGERVVLGSDDDADIRVPGPTPTRATIARRDKYFYICSETSTPCVAVNGRPVMNCQLVYNDRIEIGGRRFIFREI
ncbi:MAG: FHA domain-containing protein [candidate division KSB1 bacterium]|nr:FHA domain-containing protein [candidate division KSB1 bacterium]